jgi:hypothetical protein
MRAGIRSSITSSPYLLPDLKYHAQVAHGMKEFGPPRTSHHIWHESYVDLQYASLLHDQHPDDCEMPQSNLQRNKNNKSKSISNNIFIRTYLW